MTEHMRTEYSPEFKHKYYKVFRVLHPEHHSELTSWREHDIKALDEFLESYYNHDGAAHRTFDLLRSLEKDAGVVSALLVLLRFYAKENHELRGQLLDQIMNSPPNPIIFPSGDSTL